jgi:hypothetical protein
MVNSYRFLVLLALLVIGRQIFLVDTAKLTLALSSGFCLGVYAEHEDCLR